ncbi:hypothetical protein [Pseudomonas fluorescens]|uniref:Uncharacterized protein n=1 Tax=Pseudomonas fluorescens TaxID=294 RepID=A0A5E7F205_PSEFL|nr:hypothetical protein [Pseudomonas fluorescens]VVO33054.1 hypothetical protein PS691_05099 [Pseudomonas fluorescens]
MNQKKFFKGSSQLHANPSLTQMEHRGMEFDKAPDNRKSIKTRLACSAGAILVLIALLIWISHSRFGQLLQALIH